MHDAKHESGRINNIHHACIVTTRQLCRFRQKLDPELTEAVLDVTGSNFIFTLALKLSVYPLDVLTTLLFDNSVFLWMSKKLMQHGNDLGFVVRN